MKDKQLQAVAWGLSVGAVVLAVLAWGEGNSWQLSGMSVYQLFPLFGLLAFGLMWAHYVMAALRVSYNIDKSALKSYFEITSLAVLVGILLHPSLLAWQLWKDGLGLPPGSTQAYVGDSMKASVLIGVIALVVFLAYELRRQFDKKSWWKYVQYASDTAILLIVIHSLQLGSQLQTGWYLTVWYFYVFTLIASILYIYYQKYHQSKQAESS